VKDDGQQDRPHESFEEIYRPTSGWRGTRTGAAEPSQLAFLMRLANALNAHSTCQTSCIKPGRAGSRVIDFRIFAIFC